MLQSDEFLTISLECLIFVLEQDSLCSSEAELFNSVIKWAKSSCLAKSKEVNGENLRSELGAAIQHIRFSTMRGEEFDGFVGNKI